MLVAEPVGATRTRFPFPGIVRLDGAAAYPRAPLSYVARQPVRELRVAGDGRLLVDGGVAAEDGVLAGLDRFLEQESSRDRTVIGALGFELRHWTEPHAGFFRPRALPIVALASFETVHVFDHRFGRWRGDPPPGDAVRSVRVDPPRPRSDRNDYRQGFSRVQEWIAAGDVYQVNLSIAFEAGLEGDPAALYQRLAKLSPSPYGAFLDFGDFQLLSNSPELFLARRGDTLATRPIKGTRRRGATPEEDTRLAAELFVDPKENAEHVMIVDLERNDLGRIAEIGSVSVPEFRTVETYATLHHLESLVTARLRPEVRFSDILRATFPGGSITGAPKVRVLEILDELEPEGRGFYTGGILHHPPGGDFTISLTIRTATVSDGRVEYRAGGGVVADSVADAEYDECLLKAAAFFHACRATA